MRKAVRAVVALTATVVSVIPALASSETAHAADWIPLGGPYGSDPAVLQKSNFVFVVGQNGSPYYHEFEPSGHWSPPRELGGIIESAIAPADHLVGTPSPGTFEIFGVGRDDAMWYRTQNTQWQSLGGLFVGSPTAVVFNGATYVFGIGWDDAVWYRSPTSSGWFSLGGHIISDLGITTDGTSLYVTGIGRDNAMWARRLTGSTWNGWQSLGGDVISYPATTYAAGTGYIFTIGGDGAVWYQGVTGGTWSGWYGLGGLAESAPAAIRHDNGHLDVFIVGTDLQMYSQHWNNSSWSGWVGEGGGFSSNPVVDQFDVFALGLNDLLYAGNI